MIHVSAKIELVAGKQLKQLDSMMRYERLLHGSIRCKPYSVIHGGCKGNILRSGVRCLCRMDTQHLGEPVPLLRL